ncbi:hypothetical protein KJ830_01045 [bacterium]|nr:hypothetical protein [bacterium]
MKIGMMCLWNAANGPSIHAELLGRAWVKLGHQLKIFSARKHPDARPTFQEDEDFGLMGSGFTSSQNVKRK